MFGTICRAEVPVVLVVVCVVAAGGCATTPWGGAAAGGPISPGLVLPPSAVRDLAMAAGQQWPGDGREWEYRRNDAPRAARSVPAYYEPAWVEIRTHERLRTSNGRPREYSTTHTRSRRLRLDR